MTFEASTVDLHGRHLIEASAGTGKTYSIANIFLRLLLEDHPSQQPSTPLTVDQILVVTFTNAATDELRGRIRRKVEEALQYFRGGASGDPFIIAYKQQKLGDATARLLACERLYAALLLIDDAAIFTIHGFAARAIQTFLFETGALADVDVVIGQSHKQAQHFDDLLRHLSLGSQKKLGQYLNRQGIQGRKYVAELNNLLKRSGVEVLKNARSMQALIGHYESERERLLQERKNLASQWEPIDTGAGKSYNAARDELVKVIGGDVSSRNITDAIKFCNDKYSSIKGEFSAGKTQQAIYDSPNAKTLTGLAKQLYAMMANLFAFNDNENAINTAITASQSALLELLQQHPLQIDAAQLQPDEVIQLMNEKLDDEESAAILRRVITAQYPVCMVDEFQDTDPDQFRLFDRLYWCDRLHQGNETLGLFAIGDPKQSIYAFRGADVFAYLDVKAGMKAANIHTLDTNFRSRQGVMDGVNALFRETSDAPVFVFPGIEYEHVFSCENPPQGQAQPRGIYRVGHAEPGSLVFIGHEAEESQTFNSLLSVYAADCAERILSLLQGDQRASVEKNSVEKNDAPPVFAQPGDIAVLVRDYKEAKAIKSALAKKNLTAVYLAQKDSVFQRCVFAKDLLFVLRAIDEPVSRYHLKSAFATPLLRHFATGTATLDALGKDDGYEKTIQQFSAYCKRWEEKGILPALYQLFEEQGLDAVFASRQDCDRLMTDFRHLGELLQQQFLLTGSRERLIDWYASQLSDDADTDEEAKSLRLESDDNLVKIVTLHGCKGLEYPVVFIPFFFGFKDVDLVKNPPFYHRQQDGHWKTVLDFQSDQETVIAAMRRERMAEDMRLLYVGITRAIYQCYIGISRSYHSSKSNHLLPKSCWAHLLELDEQEPSPDWAMLKARLQWRMQAMSLPVETCDFVTTMPASTAMFDNTAMQVVDIELPAPVFPASCWQVTSYSALVYQKEIRVGTASKQDEAPVTDLDEQTVSVLAVDDANWQQDIRFRLRGGTTTGDCLHKLFERMADGETLASMLDYELRAHGLLKPEWRIPENSTLEEETQKRSSDITTWLQAVVAAPFSAQLPSLQTLYASGQALPECGFDFSLGNNGVELTLSAINAVLSGICKTSAGIARKDQRQHLNGIMTGSIDLLFIHDKKIYVLDYKSNTLGKAPRFYDRKNMAEAMQESRYDLQYLIYSVAAHRYMQQRLGERYDFDQGEYRFGGVFYLFLRGMGLPEYPDHGVWFHRPEKYAIEALDAALTGGEVIRG